MYVRRREETKDSGRQLPELGVSEGAGGREALAGTGEQERLSQLGYTRRTALLIPVFTNIKYLCRSITRRLSG